MPFRIKCPNCQTTLVATEDLIGQEAMCHQCKQSVRIEAPSVEKKIMAPPVGRGESLNRDSMVPPSLNREPASREPLTVPPVTRETSVPPKPPRRDAPPPPSAPPPSLVAPPETIAPRVLVMPQIDRHRARRSRFLFILQTLIRKGNPTDASLVLTGLMATLATALLYLVFFWPIRHTYLGGLMAERGWVPYATLWFTIWAFAILIVKLWKLAGQRATPAFDLFPEDNSVVITHATVDLFQQYLSKLHLNPRRNFMDNRLVLALDHFRAGKSAEEVATVLNTQAEIDGAVVESSYTMLRVFIWAVPILGFVGTVLGISDAVQGFTGSVQAAQDIEVIKKALGQVTSGLAVAFDTTLVALVLSIVIMFPANSLQKAEEDLLASVDQCCNSGLLRCLKDD
jgi:biopolymer transport protein ExbB/TolQ